MGFLDELKKLTRPYSDEDEFFSEGDTPAPGPEGEGAQDGRASFFDDGAEGGSGGNAYAGAPVQRVSHPAPGASAAARGTSRVVNIGAGQQQVVLVKPERFEEAAEIADHLRNKHTVVLNLEAADKVTARRLVDFLSGRGLCTGGESQTCLIRHVPHYPGQRGPHRRPRGRDREQRLYILNGLTAAREGDNGYDSPGYQRENV